MFRGTASYAKGWITTTKKYRVEQWNHYKRRYQSFVAILLFHPVILNGGRALS